MKRFSLLCPLFLLSTLISPAAEISFSADTLVVATPEKPTLKIAPIGRMLMDAALFSPAHKAGFTDGFDIPEVRLGAIATYDKWTMKVEMGYISGKFAMRDVYCQFDINSTNLLRAGHFVHQFGLQSATSSSFKETSETPISDSFVGSGFNTGIMYEYHGPRFLAGLSGIVGSKFSASANSQGKVSIGTLSRLLWHPSIETGRIAHVGISGWYQSAFHTARTVADDPALKISKGYFEFGANYPTRVDNVTLLYAYIGDARGVFKLSPEFLLAKDRFSLAAQYYYMNVNRKDNRAYIMNGVYGTFRALLIGDKAYAYNSVDGCLALPNPRSLELALGYNYTNASCSASGIYGGISNDWSVTLNYYINKYMLARLRWSYTNVWDAADIPANHVNIFEARLQFKF